MALTETTRGHYAKMSKMWRCDASDENQEAAFA